MSPIDDELRAALRGRAHELAPSPDPLAGIERRAKRIRRNRVAASVAGSALAVAAIALAVPTLTPTALPDQLPPVLAMPAVPSPAQQVSPYALDPTNPWPYRGRPDAAAPLDTDAYTIEWAGRRGVLIDDVRFTPLYGQIEKPFGAPELVHLATLISSGESWWGVAQAAADGPVLLVDRPLAPGTIALSAALPGDEVIRLLVTASPQADQFEYGADDATEFVPMTTPADGVGITALDGDPATDQVRVLVQGAEIFRGPAPDLASAPGTSPSPRASASPRVSASPGPPPPSAGSTDAARPDNVLGWPARGVKNDALVERAGKAYATAKGVSRAQVNWEVLLVADNDAGQRYAVLNAWVLGQRAQVFGWIETPGRGPEPQLRPFTEKGQAVAALLLTEVPGSTVDQLVVVYQPRTGDVLYRASAGAERRSVTVDFLEGWTVIDRQNNATDDRLFVLDGNGDLDNPTFDGTVASLLCGETDCPAAGRHAFPSEGERR
jgi:hypothetical protein